MNKKDVHISGALATLLNSGDIFKVGMPNKKERAITPKQNQSENLNDSPHHTNTPSNFNFSEQLVHVDPNKVRNWQFHDRPALELGDIKALAKELVSIGQQQPCIVRPVDNDPKYKYEVIAGQRRWLAAKHAKINLKALIKNLDDHDAALCQAGENSQRKDLSEYAKGVNYSRLINSNILSRKELQENLQISKSSIRNLLSFEKIDQEIWSAIGDYSKISASTAYEMSRLISDPTQNYQKILIEIAPKLNGKNISDKQLRKLVMNAVGNKQEAIKSATEVKTSNGRHIFTWRKDSNGNRSITFPKDIREVINFQKLTSNLRELIEFQLKEEKEL